MEGETIINNTLFKFNEAIYNLFLIGFQSLYFYNNIIQNLICVGQ